MEDGIILGGEEGGGGFPLHPFQVKVELSAAAAAARCLFVEFSKQKQNRLYDYQEARRLFVRRCFFLFILNEILNVFISI
jgi:hypothetical protein